MDQEKLDWLKARQSGIGGSDVAAILGLNPWKSAVSVYIDKTTDDIKDIDNERMRVGRDLEDYVAQRFSEATGFKVRRRNAILRHPDYDFILGNVDRLLVGEKIGLECKTTNSYAKADWEGDKIPAHYELQCHHYMLVTGYKAWYIAVLIGNEKFVYKKIERDEELLNDLLNAEIDFWTNYVQKGELPPPDGSEDVEGIIKEKYPESNGTAIILNELDQWVKIERYKEVKGLISVLDTEKKQIEQEIKLEMGEAEKAQIGDTKITWSTVTSNRLDTKALKVDHPEIYEQYAKESVSRRFTIK